MYKRTCLLNKRLRNSNIQVNLITVYKALQLLKNEKNDVVKLDEIQLKKLPQETLLFNVCTKNARCNIYELKDHEMFACLIDFPEIKECDPQFISDLITMNVIAQ